MLELRRRLSLETASEPKRSRHGGECGQNECDRRAASGHRGRSDNARKRFGEMVADRDELSSEVFS